MEVPRVAQRRALSFQHPRLLDFVWRCRSPEKPRPDSLDRTPKTEPIQIEANTLSDPDDLKAAVACVELCREICIRLRFVFKRPSQKREWKKSGLAT